MLNAGNPQRVVMIAADFRKEMTATAVWLLRHGIAAQCFRVTPFAMGDALFLDLQQIISVPDAEEYMIGIGSKENEERAVEGTRHTRHELRLAFWRETLEAMQHAGVTLYRNVSPSQNHWLSGSSAVAGCGFNLIFGKSEARVEVYFSRTNGGENKAIFDALADRRDEIEDDFGAPLNGSD